MTWDLFWDDLTYLPGYVFGGQFGCDLIETGVDVAHETVEAVKILPEMPAMLEKIWETFEELIKEERVMEALKTKKGDMEIMDWVKFVVEVASIIPGVSLIQGSIQFGEELGALNVGNEKEFRKKRAEAVMSFISVIPVNKIPVLFKKTKTIKKDLAVFRKFKKADKAAKKAEKKADSTVEELNRALDANYSLNQDFKIAKINLKEAEDAHIGAYRKYQETGTVSENQLAVKKATENLDSNSTQIKFTKAKIEELTKLETDLTNTKKAVSKNTDLSGKLEEKKKTVTSQIEEEKLNLSRLDSNTQGLKEAKTAADNKLDDAVSAKGKLDIAKNHLVNESRLHKTAKENFEKNSEKIVRLSADRKSTIKEALELRKEANDILDKNKEIIEYYTKFRKPTWKDDFQPGMSDWIQYSAFEIIGRREDLEDVVDDENFEEELLLTIKFFSRVLRPISQPVSRYSGNAR